MIEPVRMVKIRVVGSKDVLDQSIQTLYELGVVHIDSYKPGKYKIEAGYFDIGTPFERASNFSEQWVRLKAIEAALKINPNDVNERIKADWDCGAHLKMVEETQQHLAERIKGTQLELAHLSSNEETLSFFDALKIKPKQLPATSEIAVISGVVPDDFEAKLKKITTKYELFKAQFKGKIGFVLLIQKQFDGPAHSLLAKSQFKEIKAPEKIEFQTKAELDRKTSALQTELQNLTQDLANLKAKEAPFLLSYEKYLSKENEKAEAPMRFATTTNSFFIDGYVPTKNYERLAGLLKTRIGESVYLERFDGEVEFAPTQLENPRLVDAFEFFLNMYSLPFYKELDPTFLIFLTFPLFFGFMLGDIGYGLVTLLLFGVIRYVAKTRILKGLMNIGILASIASIAFGFVFAEFFGLEEIGRIQLHPIIARACALGGEGMMHCNPSVVINQMLFITVLVGFIHINIGFLLGFVNAKRHHGILHAILAKLSWLVVETGVALMLFKLTNKFYTTMPYQLYVGAGILAIGMVMLAIGEGPMGLIELPSLFSNALSYARLFAIGLSSVALAVIINIPLKTMIGHGVVMTIVGILILIFGHILNTALGILGGFLQSLRLHYVEFFTKFYHGGGKQYDPFGGRR